MEYGGPRRGTGVRVSPFGGGFGLAVESHGEQHPVKDHRREAEGSEDASGWLTRTGGAVAASTMRG